MKNIAVILAGGSGVRLGDSTPKQFLKIAGKRVIEHTLDVFEKHPQIDEICVVTKPEYIESVEEMVLISKYTKVKKILRGGKERYASSLSAINAYTNDEDNLIFHDAVRPLVNGRIINDCIVALNQYNAIDVAVKTTDTIVEVNDDYCIDNIPMRNKLRNGQTPQCFKRGTIARAYELALSDPNFVTTDDCGVVRNYLPEEKIYVVEGEVFNMKLTYIEDLFLLDKLFQLKSVSDNKVLTPKTIDEAKDKVIVVFGGSYGIGEHIVELGTELGGHIYSFSRSQNGVDVSDFNTVQQVLKDVYDKHKRIDSVICTAGILVKEPLYSMSNDSIEQSIMVNYLGAVNVAKASQKYLSRSQGSLLLFTSSSYTRGRMMYSIYSSTKAAIVNLVQALAEE